MSRKRRTAPHRVESPAEARPDFSPGRAAGLLFLSGAASLVFETLWVKQLGLVVGVDVQAVTIALSAFFAGLGLGAAALGRRVDRSRHPARLYAGLEVLAGLLGAVVTLLLSEAAPAFVALQTMIGPLAFALPFVLVGLPAFAMGGTLPALVRAVSPSALGLAGRTGRLYAANTAGAVLGTLATPFLLVPAFGVRGTGIAAGVLDLLAAGLAFLAARQQTAVDPVTPPATPATRSPEARALRLYAVAGGVALGYQVVWSQAIVPFLSTRTAAFAVLVATYLTGLALGSALWARMADRVRRPWMAFGLLVAGAGLLALASLSVVGDWLPRLQGAVGALAFRLTGNQTIFMCARFAAACVVMILPATLLLGAAFPAALRVASGASRVGREVGTMLAWNTAGGIAGTLLTGLVLVPGLGLVRTLGVLVTMAAVLGALAILVGAGERTSPVLAAALIVAAIAAAFAAPADTVARYVTSMRGGTALFRGESAGGSVLVLEQTASRGSFRRLYIDGVSNSGDTLTSLRYMRLQALLPLLIHRGQPRSALVVGLGTGITAGALLTYPDLDRRVVVELLPAVVRATPFFRGNYGAATDPRLEVRVGDGRHELMRDGEAWDLITLEPPPPSAAGVVNLYSSDFYALCRRRLAPGGLMAQWWPVPTQNDEASRSLVRSFLDVFPHATLWTTELHEMLLVGSADPIELDAARVASRLASPAMGEALREVGVGSPAALLATWVTDRAGLERYAGDAPPVTDDRPRIEHAGWVRPGEFERVLPRVLALATDPPLVGDDSARAAVASERRRLFRFYEGALAAYARDRGAWEAAMRDVLPGDPDNPYYRWFTADVR